MTATNPHPLANPLNSDQYAAYETRHMPTAITYCNDPSKLQVPDSSVSYENAHAAHHSHDSLTVPYSAVDDIYDRNSAGFIGHSSFFKLHDGSILDLKTHKIVFDPNTKFKAVGYWNDQAKTIERRCAKDWEKTQTIESILRQYDACGGNYDPNLSPESINYWRRAKEESKKLEQNMTDEQKKLLAALNNEQFFPMSKLEEE